MRNIFLSLVVIVLLSATAHAEDGFWLSIGKGVRIEQPTAHGVLGVGSPIKVLSESGPILSIGGSVQVYGTVAGDLMTFGSPVHVYPDARVLGSLSAWGAKVVVDEGAHVQGSTYQRNPYVRYVDESAFRDWFSRLSRQWELPLRKALFWLHLVLLVLLFGAGSLWQWRRPNASASYLAALRRRPVLSTAVLFLQPLIIGLLSIVLACTVIGLLLVPALWFFWILALAMGYVITATWLGQLVLQRWSGLSRQMALLLGLSILYILSYLPWLGCGAQCLAGLLGATALIIKIGTQAKEEEL